MGPLLLEWSMRFEGKHAFFNLAASNAHNYINICKTLSRKHEQYYAKVYFNNKYKNGIDVQSSLPILLKNLLPIE